MQAGEVTKTFKISPMDKPEGSLMFSVSQTGPQKSHIAVNVSRAEYVVSDGEDQNIWPPVLLSRLNEVQVANHFWLPPQVFIMAALSSWCVCRPLLRCHATSCPTCWALMWLWSNRERASRFNVLSSSTHQQLLLIVGTKYAYRGTHAG